MTTTYRSSIEWEICEISDGYIHRIKAVGGKLCVYDPPIHLLEWKKIPQKPPVKLSGDQSAFIKAALSGANIFLTGKAGTGKSFAVKHLMELLKEQGKKSVAIAPTGIAANNIGGQTIHSLFGIAPFGVASFETANFLKSEKRRMLNAINTILIDEVSMLRPDILDAMNWTLLKNGCKPLNTKQIIFIGDLKQLPPVLNDNTKSVLFQTYDGENFFHAKIYKSLRVQDIELKEVLRQSDPEFINNLNLIRDGEKAPYFKQFLNDEPKGIILAPYNSTAEEYNQAGLAAINGEEFVFTAKVEGNAKADEFNVQSEIRMKNGAKIMYLFNSDNKELVNGTLGIFVSHKDCHYIRVGEVDYALGPIKFVKKEYVLGRPWRAGKDGQPEQYGEEQLLLKEIGSIEQYPIRLAYALSIHKSQGLTFDEATIDIRRPCFMPGQFYVAVSRVRTPGGLRIRM